MNTQAKLFEIDAMIETIQASLRRLDRLPTRVPGQMDYVIASGALKNALYIRFAGGKPIVCGLANATRYSSWAEAKMFAAALVDGNGTRGSALPLSTAIDYATVAAREALDALKAVRG